VRGAFTSTTTCAHIESLLCPSTEGRTALESLGSTKDIPEPPLYACCAFPIPDIRAALQEDPALFDTLNDDINVLDRICERVRRGHKLCADVFKEIECR